jgi:two-component system NtrC family response regulator
LAFDQDALRALGRYHWPGNVRQLENIIRRAVIMAEGKRLVARDLELSQADGGSIMTLKDARDNLERDMLHNALRKHSGKIAPAAVELGISRPTIYDMIEKYGTGRK